MSTGGIVSGFLDSAENASYQKQIIEPQNRPIEKQEEQLNSVKSTV